MSDGLWWRKVKRGIIRDDRLEQVAYSLPVNLRPMVISWYMVAYMLADDDGVFDFEDGGIFALRTFSSIDDVLLVKEQMEKRNVIQNVIGGKSSIYLLNDWIDVQDGSQYNVRSSQTAEQRRARVARKIEAEQKAKVESSTEAAAVRQNINQYKKQRKNKSFEEMEEESQAPSSTEDYTEPIPVDVLARRAADLFNFVPDDDTSTKNGEMSKHTQDKTEQDNTIQENTIQDSTAKESTAEDNTFKYAAAAADMPHAEACDLNIDRQCTQRPVIETEAVKQSYFNAIFDPICDFFRENVMNLAENERGEELICLKKLTDRLLCYQSPRNTPAAIVSLYLSLVKKHKDYTQDIRPSELLKPSFWYYTDSKLNKILSIKQENITETPKDSP